MRRVMLIALALVACARNHGVDSDDRNDGEPASPPTSIKIGGTFPLSGPASLYATIPVAMKAYFSYINARRGPDGKRGVYGRQIIWNYKDDQYSPPNAVQLTRGLVEQDNVFAVVGSLGTEVNLAIRPYLNSKKVPQMLVSTGATTWGADWKQYPWTTGWQPAYQLEGKFYGAGDRPQQPERQDRRHLPERRLRQGLHHGPRGRPRRQGVEHRRQGAVRGHRAERRLADREAEGQRSDDLRDPRDADEDDPVVRDGERAQVVAGRDLHELRLGDRHVPDAREGERRRRPRQPDVHDAVREGSGEPEVGQRRRR